MCHIFLAKKLQNIVLLVFMTFKYKTLSTMLTYLLEYLNVLSPYISMLLHVGGQYFTFYSNSFI